VAAFVTLEAKIRHRLPIAGKLLTGWARR